MMSELMQKPFSQACENNKSPILEVLTEIWPKHNHVEDTILEIGCGTGQHAVFFATKLPWLNWQPSDQIDYLPGCRLWIEEARANGINNLQSPLELDVQQKQWPQLSIQGAFSANTVHIMHWPAVEALFLGLGKLLPKSSAFCLYGPFLYNGMHTSDSNIEFDQHLRNRDPGMGIRDVNDLQKLAQSCGFELETDNAMPANNRLLVWRHQ